MWIAEDYTAPIRSSSAKIVCLAQLSSISIDSIVCVAVESDDGNALQGHFWSALVYADDITLLAQTLERMVRMLASVEAEAASMGFNSAKMHVSTGNVAKSYRDHSKSRGRRSTSWLRESIYPPWCSNECPLIRYPMPLGISSRIFARSTAHSLPRSRR